MIESIAPAGAGALMALLEERRKVLLAEGLFDPARKRPLPYLPRVIGVVTSPTGAVIRDILHRLADRFPTQVIVWPVRVQGETCADEVAAAVAGFNALPVDGVVPRPDLLIVARGGGSIEDLWGFNEESVVRAVAASTIPIISAVGHETDTTLIDHAADLRAPTPTAAAEAAVPVRLELIGVVETLGSRQRQAVRRQAQSGRDRFRAAAAALPRPADLVGAVRQRFDFTAANLGGALRRTGQRKALALAAAAGRLSPVLLRGEVRNATARLRPLAALMDASMERRLGNARQRVSADAKLLGSLSYRAVLQRGFALVSRADGSLVGRADDAPPGELLTIELADAETIAAVVAGAEVARPAPQRRRRPVPQDDRQPELF